jgi:hypothetical protein
MVAKGTAIVTIAALCLWGCGRSSNERRVGELVQKQGKHTEQISQMSEKINTIEDKLGKIERSITDLVAAGAGGGPGTGAGMVVQSDFASTKEYQDIMQHIGTLQELVGVTQQEFVSFREEGMQAREREALRDPRTAWQAMSDPKQLSQRLDLLVKNFSGKIDDAVTRDQFVTDVENLKSKYSAQLSPQEKQEQARSLISEALGGTTNEWMTRMLEGQLRSLDEATPEQLNERVDRILQVQKMREIGEVTQKYNVPGDVVRDSGLVSFGRGGPGGFMSGERGGPAGPGRRERR